jgi:hypothetical protein
VKCKIDKQAILRGVCVFNLMSQCSKLGSKKSKRRKTDAENINNWNNLEAQWFKNSSIEFY